MTASPSVKMHEIDKFVLWPVFAAALTTATVVASGASFFMLALLAVFAIPLFFATVFSLPFFIVHVLKRQWRRAISFGLLPASVAATIVVPQTLGSSLLHLGQWARFQANLPSYELEIAKLPNNGKRFATFAWDGFAGSTTLLIYDESDELLKPFYEMNEAGRDIIRECTITPYRDHYYWCNIK
ncbi:hypothetical protein [Azospirillum brasilense]|uniref:hypothetical protein n=1 Tax=Azospirillum brasilense TaxID=192 RepID=UPI0011A48481|nr:hypothetical protein [Azospirillum brasilense]